MFSQFVDECFYKYFFVFCFLERTFRHYNWRATGRTEIKTQRAPVTIWSNCEGSWKTAAQCILTLSNNTFVLLWINKVLYILKFYFAHHNIYRIEGWKAVMEMVRNYTMWSLQK